MQKRRTRKIKLPAAAKKDERKKALFLIAGGVVLILAVVAVAYIFLSSPGKGNGAMNNSAMPGLTELFQNDVLVLSPSQATKNTLLGLSLNGIDASTVKLEWTIDGTTVTPAEPMAMSLSEEAWAKKGSIIKVRAVAGDKEYLSNEVVIANSPAEVTGVGFAEQANANDSLMVKAEARDLDGDEIRYEYAWIVNGNPAGNEDHLNHKVKRGDHVVVHVTACDSEGGCGSRSAEQTVNNMPPVIAENKSYRFENNLLEYQVTASDPDGDLLTYTLDSSPPGTYIDSANGLIRWQVPQEATGKHRLSIVVTDGKGGRSTYDLDFTTQ